MSGAEHRRDHEDVPVADSVAEAGAVTNTTVPPCESTPGGRAGRLAAGELAAMVAAVLAAHPDIEYTPAMLSHMLGGRSSGAIHNALERQVKIGTAVRVCDRPRRYQHANTASS